MQHQFNETFYQLRVVSRNSAFKMSHKESLIMGHSQSIGQGQEMVHEPVLETMGSNTSRSGRERRWVAF